VPLAPYRIAVGKRQKVEPRQIVGAIANEGGLGRQDVGHIDIRAPHSSGERPADLPAGTLARLRGTRISGQLIELTPDRGPRSGGAKRPR
jgi:ATP-dependent RNA helicase DeaD